MLLNHISELYYRLQYSGANFVGFFHSMQHYVPLSWHLYANRSNIFLKLFRQKMSEWCRNDNALLHPNPINLIGWNSKTIFQTLAIIIWQSPIGLPSHTEDKCCFLFVGVRITFIHTKTLRGPAPQRKRGGAAPRRIQQFICCLHRFMPF